MRIRQGLITLALVTAALTGPAASAHAKKLPGKAQARIVECRAGAFSVEATMSTSDATQRLSLRYDILERQRGDDVFRVRRDAVGVAVGWVTADPGFTGYKNDQVVMSVSPGSVYRVRVRFRWTDASGHVVARATRVTGACKQKESRPDLRVGNLSVEPARDPANVRYVAIVRNAGPGISGPFDVVLTVGDRSYRQTVTGLPPGRRTPVVFVAPRCTGGEAIVVGVDDTKQVEEINEDNNSGVRACPR